MKLISVLVPTFNEEANVRSLSEAIIQEFEQKLSQYDYEILFIDNCSEDKTQAILTELCRENHKIKAIFNSRNFGQLNSPFYGMMQTKGDCTICMCADFQDPVEMLSTFVQEWEAGYKIVCGIKTTSKENRIVRFLRTCYYKVIKRLSNVEMIEHFTGFGLYDKSFIDTLRDLKEPTPFLRGIVAELGPKRKEIPYEQPRRRAGKTSNNWYSLFDIAMLSFTSYTKVGLRIATIAGFIFALIGFVVAIVYLIMKLIFWQTFAAGMAPILIGVFLFGSVQMFFIGLLGEYILSINSRIMNRPLVIEEKRINF
jgi:polyisoprenyl-phosphate glycosyltransferase